MVRTALRAAAKKFAPKSVINALGRTPEAEPKPKIKTHRLLVVVKMTGGEVYHIWSKDPLHTPHRRYDGEISSLLELAFGFSGSRSAHCLTEQPKLKHFQHENVDWNPRQVDWSMLVSFSALEPNYEKCHIVPEEESPFKGKIKTSS